MIPLRILFLATITVTNIFNNHFFVVSEEEIEDPEEGLDSDANEVVPAPTKEDVNGESQGACRLWLGESTLSTEEKPKFGLFAGVDYDKEDVVGAPEVGIPVVDFIDDWHKSESTINKNIISFMEGYFWTADFVGAAWESIHSIVMAIPGAGVLSNYHSGSYNIDWRQSAALMRVKDGSEPPAGVAHPSRGAIANYHNITFRATQKIKSGMELFANFGDVWDKSDADDDIYQDKLTRQDYKDADKVLNAIVDFMNQYEDEMTADLKDNVLTFLMEKVLGTAAGSRAKVIRSLIPDNPKKLQNVKDVGGTFQYRNSDLSRSPKWLQKHGRCVDGLRSGPSTIAEAGRGAFAARPFVQGQVVTSSPMMHIPKASVLDMYKVEDDEANLQKPLGKQLLLNYCFGHKESSMLLFPVGSLVGLINHKPVGDANAKINWSRLMSEDYWWHDQTPDTLTEDTYNRLAIAIDIIATKPIAEGEEIFIDYGADWSEAWNTYASQWSSQYGKEHSMNQWPLKANDVKEEYKTKPFKTQNELRVEPYPASVATIVYAITAEQTDGLPKENENGLDILRWAGPNSLEELQGNTAFACDVIERVDDEEVLYKYNVICQHNNGDGSSEVHGVPHWAITFVDRPYQSDTFIQGAFRHYIGIDDSIFPQAWRDKA